jgi:hypothetical protein
MAPTEGALGPGPQEAAAPPEGGSGQGASGTTGQGSPASPEEDPAFQAVVGRVGAVAAQEQAHAPAQAVSVAAQSAAVGPGNEVASQAATAQVQEMDQQQPQPFDRAAFKAALMQKITETAPRNMKEADEFKESNQLSSVPGAVPGRY